MIVVNVLQPLAGIGSIVLVTCAVLYWYGRRMEKNPERNVIAQGLVAKAEADALARLQPMVDAAMERAVSAALSGCTGPTRPVSLPSWHPDGVDDDAPNG